MRKSGMLLALVLGLGGSALAADKGASPAKGPEMTAEQRQKMAEAHEKMAACLRSTRPLAECHDEMMKSCQEHMGKGGCPMMGMGHRHHKAPGATK